MDSFQELKFKEHYDSQRDDLLNDFYIPALANCKKYRRIVGYFNSKSLSSVAPGLKEFILNGSKMDLVCGVDLDQEDVKMVKFASENPEEIISSNFLNELESIEEGIVKNHVEILGWMIANKLLRIRVAVKVDKFGVPKVNGEGILHYKIGLMNDFEGNLISFSGSINETASAWENNLEEFHLFRSWDTGELVHLKENQDTFSDLWNSKRDSYRVFDIPKAVEQKLIDLAPKKFDELNFDDFNFNNSRNNNDKIELYDYQKNARDLWLENDKRGIFVMATGTGKTFTALSCLEKVFKEYSQVVTIISAPSKHLLSQWDKAIVNYGLNPDRVLIVNSDVKWKPSLESALLDIRLNNLDKLIILVTHDTLPSFDFMNMLKQNKKTNYFLIGDEMHGLGSNYRKIGLMDEYDFRLGLSATPTRYSDKESDALFNFFGKELYNFSLKKAIYSYNPATKQSYLTPYNYFPYFLNLNSSELKDYKKLTLELFKYYDKDDVNSIKSRESIYFKRANIVKDAKNKFSVLNAILDDMEDYSGLIVYCSHNQIDRVMNILSDHDIVFHKFTMDEGTKPVSKFGGISERDLILEEFSNGTYQALVAMHCLDEGVDVPFASKAIFMCSSNSSREFIQRIGRVIRRAPGKTHADIYDLIVKPNDGTWDDSLKNFEKSIFEKEKERYKEIGFIAENYGFVIDKLNDNL